MVQFGAPFCAPEDHGFNSQSAHTQVAGSILGLGTYERQLIDVYHIDVSLPFLSKNQFIKKAKKKKAL